MGDLLWGEIPKKRIDAPQDVNQDEQHKHWFYQITKTDELMTCECFPADFKKDIIDAIKRGREKRNARRK